MQNTDLIRNLALFGDGKSGKTSLAEGMLFAAGKTSRLGKVDDGTSTLDFEPEEITKKVTINSSFHQYTWKKHDVYLIDTPGDDNFINDAMFAANIADSAVLTVDAVGGIKYQSERICDIISERKLPAIIYINKMDRERADFEKTLDGLKNGLPLNPVVIQLPIGAEADFKGVVDIIRQKAYIFDDSDTGKTNETDIPADMIEKVEPYREQLMELVAETDDDLIEKYLEDLELSETDLKKGLKNAAKSGKINPVCVGAATGNLGTTLLLDTINELLPSPADRPPRQGTIPGSDDIQERKPDPAESFSAQVFKTMADPYAGRLTIFRVFSGILDSDVFYNSTKGTSEKFGQLLIMEGKNQKPVKRVGPGMIAAVAKLKETVTGDTLCTDKAPIVFEKLIPIEPIMSYAVTTSQKGDEEKLFSSISRMLEEDPTLRLDREPQTGEILLSGVGQVHLRITGEKIKRKFGVSMDLHIPKVPYLETIKGKTRVQGKHKKQTGGRGQYADSWLEIEPLPRGGGFEFADKIVGGVIPRQYIPAVEKGIIEALGRGIIAGYPVVDVKTSLVDGSFHNVDSSEMAFKISGSLAFKKGAPECKPVLLEPIVDMTIRMPKECVGDVIGDLNGRRGKVMGMDSESKKEIILAQAPQSEILEYAPDLISITGGRGSFSVKFSHYQEIPSQLAEKVIEAAKQQAG